MQKPTTAILASDKVRTTIDLPAEMRQRIQQAVKRGFARSQNALMIQALEHYLEDLERNWIDAQFASMADDPNYQALQLAIANEFAPLDRESWTEAEGAYATR